MLAHRLPHRLDPFTPSKLIGFTRSMATHPVDADFCVSWLLGLQTNSSSPPAPSVSYHHITEDADFTVSWLLGISGYQTLEEEISIWIKENESDDPQFRVTWLLGLEPKPGRCWGWAAEYETEDPDFLGVSHILGLTPTPEGPVVEDTESEESDCSEEQEEELVDEEDELGLQRLFGELPYVTEPLDDGMEVEKEPEEAPVLATQEFLDLCAQMDDMLSALEYALSYQLTATWIMITNIRPGNPP